MAEVPVLCHNCKALYGATVLEGALLGNTQLGNNPIPCPFCGNMGYTIEGLYSSVEKAVQIVSNSLSSEKSLSFLTKKLEEYKRRELDPHIFKQEILQNAPELKCLTDTLPKTRSELYAFIAVLLTAITVLLSTITHFPSPNDSITKENVKEIVKEAVNKTITETALLRNRTSPLK